MCCIKGVVWRGWGGGFPGGGVGGWGKTINKMLQT